MASKQGPKDEKKENQLPTPAMGGAGGGDDGNGGDDERALTVQRLEGSAEIQAAVIMAKKFPRDEDQAQGSLMKTCQRPIFAEGAFYAFPRGRKLNEKTGEWEVNIVTGPSIKMARELARTYGNFRYGFFITHEDDDGRQIVAYAWDVETNNRTTSSDYFKKLIQRRVGAGRNATTIPVTPDERELRELTNRRASILMRNCILSLLPGYFVDEAVKACKDTVGGKPGNEVADRIAKMTQAFGELGIGVDKLETYLKKPVTSCTPEDLGDLRGIYESLRDGVISPQERAELFEGSRPEEPAKGPGIDAPALSEKDMKPSGESPAGSPEGQPQSGETQGSGKAEQPPGPKDEAKTPERKVLTPAQRKEITTALRKTKKTLKDVDNYLSPLGRSIEKPMTPEEFQDVLGFASFVPPKDEPKKKEPAKKDNGETPADPQAAALKLIEEMTVENFTTLRAQVIGLCNQIKGTANIVKVTVALGEKQKKIHGAP